MALLQFVGKGDECPLKLREDMIPFFPWYDIVNRVIPQKLDPFITTHEVPNVFDVKKNLKEHKYEDLMNARATEILSLNQPIYLMWSGGIDSSAVFVALMKNATPQQIKDIHIVCSTDSAKEYPEMWLDINKNFQGRIHSAQKHPSEYCKKGIVVTGELGDQCFGSDVLLAIDKNFGFEALMKPYQETMPLIYEKMFGPNKIVEKYEQTLFASEFPIKTAFDWVWWMNFTNKWNHVRYAMLGMEGWGDPVTTFDRVHRFFDTIEWQQWSMTSPHLKIKNDVTTYKWLAKDFIQDYTKHQNYGNKKKEPSLGKLWRLKTFKYGITPQMTYLTLEQTKEYVRK